MIILGVDTSCDDTSIAVLRAERGKFELLSNIVSSQVKIHQKYGGVYPALARRAHEQNLPKVFNRALKSAKVGAKDIDAISVTIGPGLDPCLWMSLNFVRALAFKFGIPIIPVNHIEGHILANWLRPVGSKFKIQNKLSVISNQLSVVKFPAICLVVSGGHTQLILMKKIKKYEILGETRDDAAGECFDKTARILGLGYPGGPAIATQAALTRHSSLRGAPRSSLRGAQQGDAAISPGSGNSELNSGIAASRSSAPRNDRSRELTARDDGAGIKLPRPMIYTKDYDFSFSGLKTAVLYDYKKRVLSKSSLRGASQQAKRRSNLPPNYIQAMSAKIQQAIIDVLLKKTIKASRDYKTKTIILGGGVVANQELRTQFQDKIQSETNFALQIPDLEFCQDNGAMIAITGWFNRAKAIKSAKSIKSLKPLPNLRLKT